MANIAILNSEAHRNLRVHAGASARHGDNQRFVAVIVNEFSLLVPHYPILLSKDSNTGAFYCGAMLGFDTDENLFLDEWKQEHGPYRPLNLQRGPFYTAGSDLAIDLDNPRVNVDGEADADGTAGQVLFDDEGQPSDYLQSIIALMRDLRPGLERTKVFVQTLMQHQLVEPIDIDVAFDDGSRRQVEGLYVINQEALHNLPDATVLELFRRGYLHLIYTMMASLKQVPVLAQKKNRRIIESGASLALG